mgnify:FL=1
MCDHECHGFPILDQFRHMAREILALFTTGTTRIRIFMVFMAAIVTFPIRL